MKTSLGESIVRNGLVVFLAALVLAAFGPAASRAADDEAGFKPIFNGKDLEGWDGNPEFWSVEDGAITGRTTQEKPTKGNTFVLWREGELDDFELRLQYKIVGGNSGIQYRSTDMGNWVVGGYQGDFEAGDGYSGILYEERGRGILAKRGEKTEIGEDGKPKVVGSLGNSAELQKSIKKEDWNDYKIIARGNHLQHFINGKQMVDVVDNDMQKRQDGGHSRVAIARRPADDGAVQEHPPQALQARRSQEDRDGGGPAEPRSRRP